ncbi:hypothetical protein F5Y19DRAFT_425277 [Xylariaceae sp. FL1651]|nr:hypothetical protein F5Y19DRAFT_425277 [Xylariaceae sp. FL1651]
MHVAKLAFGLHTILETAAGVSFIIHPEGQLPGCTPEAKLILRQYGGLLLASSMACLAILADAKYNDTTRLLAMALGSYHVWPCHRALTRIRHESQSREKVPLVLGGPLLHLVVHVVCLGLFVFSAFSGP